MKWWRRKKADEPGPRLQDAWEYVAREAERKLQEARDNPPRIAEEEPMRPIYDPPPIDWCLAYEWAWKKEKPMIDVKETKSDRNFELTLHGKAPGPFYNLSEPELRELVEKGARALGVRCTAHHSDSPALLAAEKALAENARLRKALEKIHQTLGPVQGTEGRYEAYTFAHRALAGEDVG